MKKIIVAAMLLAVILAPVQAFAAEASPWTSGKTYGEKVVGKLDYGMKNTLGGWTQIVTEPFKCTNCQMKDKNTKFPCPIAFTTGLVKGTFYAAIDTVGGALHLATFPIPAIDVPLPDGGVKFE